MTGEAFANAYRQLERRMKELADDDGDVYIPNPVPLGPAEHVLVCMEPSLGGWTRGAADARARVAGGFRNFLSSMEDFVLHFSAERFLCARGERYHLTDFAKGAMTVVRAAEARRARYDRWYPLLAEELRLVARPGATIVAVGNAVFDALARRGVEPLHRIIHYSGQAASARRKAIVGREDEFRAFCKRVSHENLVEHAASVLEMAGVPNHEKTKTLERLARGALTDSRKALMFSYKLAFERVRHGSGR